MERLCCILDGDECYAVRLSACFNGRRVLPFPFRAFSDAEAYLRCAKENEVELLLVAEDMYPAVGSGTARLVVRLCGQSVLPENESGAVDIPKYQASDNIIRDVVSLYGDMRPDILPVDKAAGAKLVCVYSPNGGVGKTTLCMALAHEKGQNRKVLYINLEEFSADSDALPERNGSLSDALFYYHTGNGCGVGKLMSVINRGNGFDYIPPAVCAEDLAHFSTEIIMGMLDRLSAAGGYELIIIDVGGVIKEVWRLLEQADIILTPRPDSPHRERRQMEFEKYLHQTGRSEVADRIVQVDIPRDDSIFRDGSISYARLSGSVYGRLVSSLDI